ncbi:hypothetical protein Dimus_039183 [Dionaea muscipula]
MPSSVLQGEVPHHVLFPGQPIHPLPLRIFGCTCYIWVICPHLTKLDPKSLRCIFLGYSRTQKGYRCYSPELGRFCIYADVVFDEATPFSSSPLVGSPSESSSSVDDLLIYELVQTPSSSPPVPNSPLVSTSSLDSLPALPIRVYTRRPRQVVIDQLDYRNECAPTPVIAPLTAPDLDSSLVVHDSDSSPPTVVSSPAAPPSSAPSDLDLLIALRKG